MPPKDFHFGGGPTESTIYPLVVIALLVVCGLILARPRRTLLLPFLWLVILTPNNQQLYLGGMHWSVLRIAVLFGCIRLVIERIRGNRKLFAAGITGIDWAVFGSELGLCIAPILLYRTPAIIPTQAGTLFQDVGGYLLLRFLIQDEKDIRHLIRGMAPLALTLGLCMLGEQIFRVNVFGVLQTVPFAPILRNGIVRAQAGFAHPILAGCVGATLAPLFYWLWRLGGSRKLAIVGITGSLLMVGASASSTPALGFAGGILALCLWPVRRWMRQLRWGMALLILGLQIAMKAPVWFLIARVNVTGSSDSYDRAKLIDTCVQHFHDWWLIGADSSKWGWDMWDLSNRFVGVAETGGLISLVLFILVISRAFGRLGKARKRVAGNPRQEWLVWALGAVLFAHILCYIGVSYFDQTVVWWFATLAAIVAAGTFRGKLPYSLKVVARQQKLPRAEQQRPLAPQFPGATASAASIPSC